MSAPGININFTEFGTDQLHPLGTKADGPAGCSYRYVKHIGADTAAAGKWANMAATYGTVTMTAATAIINGVSTVALAAGVYQSAMTTNTYGWVQTSGPGQQALTTDGGVAAGDPLVIDGGATAVGVTDTMADGEEESICGWALAADSSTTQTAGTYYVSTERFW